MTGRIIPLAFLEQLGQACEDEIVAFRETDGVTRPADWAERAVRGSLGEADLRAPGSARVHSAHERRAGAPADRAAAGTEAHPA